MIELSPCPFCGSSKAFMASDEDDGWNASAWWVECGHCRAHGPDQYNDLDKQSWGEIDRSDDECKRAAISAWNDRHELR